MAEWRNWDSLRFVVALGNSGSMINATKILGVSAATVSRKILSANEQYGQKIFQKHQDGWNLTAAGHQLYDLARDFEESLSVLQKASEEEREHKPLLLTSLDFLIRSVLFPNYSLLREKNPFIELTLHSSNANLSLAYGEADIAIRMARPTSGRLVSRKLGEFTYSLYGTEGGDHTNWVGREENLDDVAEIGMAKQFFQRPPVIRVADYKSALDAMKALRVATVLPDVAALDDPEVIKIDGTPVVRREAWLVVHEDRKSDSAIRAIIEWLEICFEEYVNRVDVRSAR